MHALTRPMSEMYCWQSRIASGSQAARCCGVHCCAAAGQDATMSASPSNTAAAAFIGPRFCWALRMSIIALHFVSEFNNHGAGRQLSLVTGALDECSALGNTTVRQRFRAVPGQQLRRDLLTSRTTADSELSFRGCAICDTPADCRLFADFVAKVVDGPEEQ